jgi:ABC-type uncharacterized transport system substrate-binding protein
VFVVASLMTWLCTQVATERQCVGSISMRFFVDASTQSVPSLRTGNTSACGAPLLSITHTSRASSAGAIETGTIVFVQVLDPVGGGIVESLARPGGNATGLTLMEYGTAGKHIELLKEIAPRLTRAAVVRDPSNTSGTASFAAMQAVAPSLGMELRPVDVRAAADSGLPIR